MPARVEPLQGFAPFRAREWDVSQLQFARSIPKDLRQKIVAYLSGGSMVVAWMEHTFDELGGAFGVPGGSGLMTDGKYYWRRDASYYVEHYDASVTEDALRHFASNGWRPPSLTLEVLNDIEDAIGDL